MTYKRLFIAEKPDVARHLADYLGRQSGCDPKRVGRAYAVGGDVVAPLRGHVLELADADAYDPAYKDWSLDHLPIIPTKFKLNPIKDKSEHLKTIKSLLPQCEEVVGCCDAGDEGQLIQDQLLEYLGNKKPTARLWMSGLNDAEMGQAFTNMKPNSHYRPVYEAALARSHADWLYGINLSRAVTLHARARGADFAISIGRVQTPTLALVVEREQEIRTFTPTDHYRPYIDLAHTPGFRAKWIPRVDPRGNVIDPRINADGLMTDLTAAKRIVAGCVGAGRALVVKATTKPATTAAPLPLSLTALQARMSKLYGFKAARSLKVAQELYEAKILSYPRTDSTHLLESQHSAAGAILSSLAKASLPAVLASALRATNPALKSKAFDDKKAKANDHHAIVPLLLEAPEVIAGITEDQKKLYCEVVRFYILQFYPVATYQATEVVLSCGEPGAEEMFLATGRRYLDYGWMKAFAKDTAAEDEEDGESPETDQALPALSVGMALPVRAAEFDSAVTKAPKRFTEGTLLAAMENVHKFVKDPGIKKMLRERAGIGTVATRTAIIERLLEMQVIETEGKYLRPTNKGEQIVRALPSMMTAPDMTALWQSFMDAIKEGRSSYGHFIDQQAGWIREMIQVADRFFENVHFEGKPQAEMEDSSSVCFGEVGQRGCGSPLRRIKGKFGWFFGCTNPACKKIFEDKDGVPVEKAARASSGGAPEGAPSCPTCKKGFLRRMLRKTDGHPFWGCSNYRQGCPATFDDRDGAPDYSATKET